MSQSNIGIKVPEIEIDVVERSDNTVNGKFVLDLSRDLKFSTSGLESYAFARWEPSIFDAMVVAAAVEYGDRIIRRPPLGWARRICLNIPVHDPDRWNSKDVSNSLQDATEFLTGDYWRFNFTDRKCTEPSPRQDTLRLPINTEAVLPYSDGMDSQSVAGIIEKDIGEKLVRVRVKSTDSIKALREVKKRPFAVVPYDVPCNMSNRESSGRSRGFKFALISGIAAYLSEAKEIIIPESGQGAIGPALIGVGQTYPDYRNHPLFAIRMERFLNSLFESNMQFTFPRLWNTKGETLREYVAATGSDVWQNTRSCWRNNRWCSVNHRWRHCGICAACMLRRLSVHSACLTERRENYVVTNMMVPTLEEAVDKDFSKLNSAFREYAIAGVLHMHHLADIVAQESVPFIRTHATVLAPALNMSPSQVEERLFDLIRRHATEWENYLDSLGSKSFVALWTRINR